MPRSATSSCTGPSTTGRRATATFATAVVGTVAALGIPVLLGAGGGALLEAASAAGIATAAEAFCDRGYGRDGALLDRAAAGGLLSGPAVAAQAVAIALRGEAPVAGGGTVAVVAESLCLHGDSPGRVGVGAPGARRPRGRGRRPRPLLVAAPVSGSRAPVRWPVRLVGDAAVRLGVAPPGSPPDLAAAIEALGRPEIDDVVVGHESVTVLLDPVLADPRATAEALAVLPAVAPEGRRPELHDLPVAFDGPDLAAVAAIVGLSEAEVIQSLVEAELLVAMVGFVPGFGYLKGLPRLLEQVPRRDTPRPRLAPGSVALAGGYAGVYPRATPGGWQVVGATAAGLFDPERPPFARLRPGDRVRLRRTTEAVEATEAPRRPIRSGSGDARARRSSTPACS